MRKQREEDDFWDEHDDPQSESGSDKSNFDESSLDECSFDKKTRRWIIEGKIIHMKGWETKIGGYISKLKISFKPVLKDHSGEYLRGILGCASSATKKRERRWEFEKSASTTRSIVHMFSAQINKSQF